MELTKTNTAKRDLLLPKHRGLRIENNHRSIIDRFKYNQIQKVWFNGVSFTSLKGFLKYYEKNI